MRRFALLLAALVPCVTFAQGAVAPVDPLTEWHNAADRDADAPLSDFRLISYFFTRFSVTNMLGDPAGLRGVALGPFGTGLGSATRVGPNSTTAFFESRWIPVIEYSPWFVDDLATMRAQFEIDFMWGLGANAVQQNSGGGLNADMINLQTKNLNVSLYPTRRPSQLAITVGIQPFYDSVLDPTRTGVAEIVRTGYKLSFLGTDGTGISIFWAPLEQLKLRAALLFIGASQPDKALMDDPRLKFALMTMFDATYELRPGTSIGVSGWWLRDDTKGQAYAFEGLVLSGPASTGLNGFTGTAKLPIEQPVGNVGYAGINFQHNQGFNTGRFAASGYFMLNAGKYETTREMTTFQRQIDILGFAADLEVQYQFGRTANDVVTLEGLYTSGDNDPADGRYTGAYTLNFYGLPGAVWFTHRTLLLFPFTSTVNNYVGAVTDISNQGLGTWAGIASAQYDVVPHTLNVKVGAAAAGANANAPVLTAGQVPGRFMGVEVNAELKWHIRYLMTVGLHGAYMFLGDFYRGNTRVTQNPFALFTTFTWYAF
ncbi:MAG: hypothetical protein JNK82_22535 [Myxococcaceae bacterium]|nr:hypothetical protein [Myxococcaceae bacterium]